MCERKERCTALTASCHSLHSFCLPFSLFLPLSSLLLHSFTQSELNVHECRLLCHCHIIQDILCLPLNAVTLCRKLTGYLSQAGRRLRAAQESDLPVLGFHRQITSLSLSLSLFATSRSLSYTGTRAQLIRRFMVIESCSSCCRWLYLAFVSPPLPSLLCCSGYSWTQ